MTNKINIMAVLLASTFLSSQALAADTGFYKLTPVSSASEDTVTLYDITETTRYYDASTGKEVAAADRKDGVEYKEVVVKTATPKYYTLGLSSDTYGSGDASKTYNIKDGKLEETSGSGDITVKYQSGTKRINNKDDAGDIDKSFAGLSYSAEKSPYGGAIYNNDNDSTGDVKINNISGDFVANHVENTSSSTTNPGGGAIYNKRGEINEISGDFIGNSVYNNVDSDEGKFAQGGAVANTGTINKITGNFAYNSVAGIEDTHLTDASSNGGAIANVNGGTIKEIDGVFIGNMADIADIELHHSNGGAIYNGSGSTIDSVTGTFIGNQAVYGGAVSNEKGTISSVSGTFINNSSYDGGAVRHANSDSKVDISGTFIENQALYGGAIQLDFDRSKSSTVSGTFVNNKGTRYGGAISVIGSDIASIGGDYIGNTANQTGGAIHISASTIDTIDGNFYDNKVTSAYHGGGAIKVGTSTINTIKGNFVNNSVTTDQTVGRGGALFIDSSSVDLIEGNFVGNSVVDNESLTYVGDSLGGAISLSVYHNSIGSINNSSFIDNSVSSNTNKAKGGAIAVGSQGNNNKISTISNTLFSGNHVVSEASKAEGGAIFIDDDGAEISEIINSSFVDNYAKGDANTAGGAIYAHSGLNIIADDGTSLFSGNKANNKSSAIFMGADNNKMIDLNLKAQNDGVITFDDGIDGKVYNLNLSGDGTGEIAFNNLVENATAITVDNTTLRLGTGSNIAAKNMSGNGTIKVDVTFAANKQIKTGVINASENLTGDYKVIANPLNDGNGSYIGASSVFLTAPNDEATFDLVRVISSPYVWGLNKDSNDAGFNWSIELTDYISQNQVFTPETVAGVGLHEAAIEQTRSVVRNVRNKVADGKVYCPDCGIMDYGWNGYNGHNAWVNVQGETATIDKPVKMDADIWGVEAGFDVQNDVNNTLGVFASYRKGEYDLSGKADKVRSNIGSEIDIDSYLAGLYYRYDKNMNWLFATVYGGIQQADAKTDDGIAKFDTDGVEFGASVEAGHTFALSSDLTLDPSLGLYYTQINFDDAKDNIGKEYSWKDIKHLEAELGAKLEKQLDTAKVYIKPSIIQTVTSGDSVKVTGLNKLSTYDDGTLGRIELGGRYGFTDALSAYGWVNYTFGSDYDVTAFGVGLNYAW